MVGVIYIKFIPDRGKLMTVVKIGRHTERGVLQNNSERINDHVKRRAWADRGTVTLCPG